MHRILGGLLPVRSGLALDRDVLPGGLRVAALVLVALGERRRFGPLPPQTIRLAAIAGIFFTGDLMFWHHAIEAVGAGLATVLGNLQVIIVGFFAWLILGERPSRATLLALPVVLVGVVLISGVIGEDAYGSAPQLGVILGIATAICYAAYLLIIRWGGRDPRRPAGPVAVATAFVAVCAFVVGQVGGDLDLTPPPASLFWLAVLGVTAQSAGDPLSRSRCRDYLRSSPRSSCYPSR